MIKSCWYDVEYLFIIWWSKCMFYRTGKNYCLEWFYVTRLNNMASQLSSVLPKVETLAASDHKSVVSINIFVALLCACIVLGHLLEENRWMNESITTLFIVSFLSKVLYFEKLVVIDCAHHFVITSLWILLHLNQVLNYVYWWCFWSSKSVSRVL